MKIILTENQIHKILTETIHPSEAYNDFDSIMTVIEGKRGLCSAHLDRKHVDEFKNYMNNFNLKAIKVPSNPYNLYIIYANGYEDRAKELVKITEKYDGLFHYNATKKDTIRIGELFEYDPEEIKKFIEKKYGISKEKN